MECKQCKTSLSLQDLDANEWLDNAEVFIIKCPLCQYETRLISFLFENDHISSQYLRMIISDSKRIKKEKYTDYIPEKQRKMLFEHLSNCSVCSDRIESLRLSEISKEIEFNENTYTFFLSKAKDIIKELDPDKKQINVNGSIKSFVFENETYEISEENLFYYRQETLDNVGLERLCYSLEKDNFSIGMVSFVKSNGKIILEKIWLKSEQRIEKEKRFLLNLRSGKIRILFELIQKLQNFV
jgi:hypothetical protein